MGCLRNKRNDSAEILFQSFLPEAITSSSGMGRGVHTLALSIQHFVCRPRSSPTLQGAVKDGLERRGDTTGMYVTSPNLTAGLEVWFHRKPAALHLVANCWPEEYRSLIWLQASASRVSNQSMHGGEEKTSVSSFFWSQGAIWTKHLTWSFYFDLLPVQQKTSLTKTLTLGVTKVTRDTFLFKHTWGTKT